MLFSPPAIPSLYMTLLVCLVVVTKSTELEDLASVMPVTQDYSLMYWVDGFPAVQIDAVPWHRAVVAGEYCMVMDTSSMEIVNMGSLDTGLTYLEAATSSEDLCSSQPGMDLTLAIVVDGEKFTCTAGGDYDSYYDGPRLIDAGRFVQRADVTNLVFTSEIDGTELPVDARLEVMASPHSLSFILQARMGMGFPPISAGEGVFGKVGSGFGLDGGNVLEVDDANLDRSVFTVELWGYIPSDYDSATTNYPWLICKGNHQLIDGNYGVVFLSGRPRASLGAGGMNIIWGPVISEFNSWNHFVLTCDGDTFQFYFNSVLMGEVTLVNTFVHNTLPTYFGRRGDNFDDGFHFKGVWQQCYVLSAMILNRYICCRAGNVDEFRMYDRVLTGAEVLSLYEDPLTCGKS